VANFFLGQSIGIDENNTFQLKFFKNFNWNVLFSSIPID